MMLDDFFTLMEVKNGITTLPRVEELINTMQLQKNCSINNICDATRQRTKVISTIAATEDEDCLKLFVKLKGLTYFNQWVQNILEFSNQDAENITEEFFSALLESLEKLPVISEDSPASEMQLISEKLVRLDNPNIKERARTLIERWTPAMEIDAGLQSLSNNENDKYANFDAVDNGKLSFSNDENCMYANFDAVDNLNPIIASDTDNPNDSQLDKTTDLSTKSSKEDSAANAIVQNTDAPSSNSSRENLSVTPGYVNEGSKDASFCKDDANVDMKQGIPSEPVQESSKVQSPSKLSVTPAPHIPEQSVPCNFDVKEHNSGALKSATSPLKSTSMQCLLSNGSNQKSDDDSKETASENMEEGETGNSSEVEVGSSEAQVGSSEPPEDKSTPRVDHSSDYGLEYGEIDALEVARQVAIEVEREVVDYREPFCNSSPDHSSREDNLKANAKCEVDLEESSKRQEATSETQTNKNKFVFDLNEDIFIDEPEPDSMENLNFNKPAVPPVSSASPKTPDIEKISSTLKRKAKCIEFDLNVVDHECDPEESIEVSSKKPQKLKLDLNQLGEEETSQPQVVQSTPFWSPASSSSSMQPKARGFDLNNNLNFFDVMGSSKKPEITIMGWKITGRKEDQVSKPLFESPPNTVSPYSQQFPVHASGFNGNMMMNNSISFPMPQYTYGTTMPCMIDSRGAPVVPQILSNVGLNTATGMQPYHFLTSSNVAGTSQSAIDVNSVEGGSINFFMQERNGMTEEQGSMRKESHSGRELYNFMSSWQ